jgi:hypothetical protein
MKSSKSFLIVRGVVGLALAILFWWFVGTRLTIPAWEVAVLPAAVIGFLSAYGETGWTKILLVAVLLGGVLSALAGEWLHVYGRLVAARQRSLNVNVEESLLAAVAKHQAEMEKTSSSNVSDQAKMSPAKGLPEVDLLSAGRIAFDRALSEWHGPVLSIVISLFAAGQAARMTVHWKQSAPQK